MDNGSVISVSGSVGTDPGSCLLLQAFLSISGDTIRRVYRISETLGIEVRLALSHHGKDFA
jgi:hypothetical protein